MRLLRIVTPALAILVLWQVVAIQDPATYGFLLGSPIGIAREARELASSGQLARDIGITASEALAGFALGTCIGTIIGLAFWYSESAFSVAKPYLVALGALPVFALAPVMIFWFGTGMMSKIIMGFLSTFVIAVMQARNGAALASRELLRMAIAFGAPKRTQFWHIVVPSAALWVISGIRLNIGMALLGAFIGELVSSRSGLGHLILVAQGLFNVNQIWVGVFSILLIAALMQWATSPIEKWANRWT